MAAAMTDENDLTYQYIERHGVSKVRGGAFIQKDPAHFKRLIDQYRYDKAMDEVSELDEQFFQAMRRSV